MPVSASAAAPPAPTGAGSIESALKSVSLGELETFYRARKYQPLWMRGNAPSPAASRLVEIIRGAEIDGLANARQIASRLEDVLDDASQGKRLGVAERALSQAWVDYVTALRRPAAGMTYGDTLLSRSAPSVFGILSDAATAPSLERHIAEVSALNPVYARLRAGLGAWRERWGSLPRLQLSPGLPLRQGSRDPEVAALRARLGIASEGGFDAEAATAVRAFQAAHGLPSTGSVDRETLRRLNEDPEAIEQRLLANLDRARFLPANERRFILVDAASQRLWLYEDGEIRDTMKVIVGKPTEPTPMVASVIRFAVANPYWHVPPDLVRTRVAENVLKEGLGFLKTKKYEIVSDWSDDAQVIDPATVDWKAVASGEQELAVRQLPGPTNAMGTIKFMFANQFGVYLHDTPDKALFQEQRRTLSSGCVRLEDAARLATSLFGSDPRPSSGGPEQILPLPQPVPVYITYFTVDSDGERLAFRDDFYGRDPRPGGVFAADISSAR
jgi:murein L,D-transpeptidase YcbB/YkuD